MYLMCFVLYVIIQYCEVCRYRIALVVQSSLLVSE